ncbi:MFS polyamine transporter [Pholiota conissans]|uniref:MFS polyamine transporter n=1 Tax=Pholiota conissans TaxID=109636 RepID=A0A9P5YNA0_9AGAR|nr:MFS polyamine transporter [Pholiota conissans]
MSSSVGPQPGHINVHHARSSRDGLSTRTDSATILPGERLSEDAEDRAMEEQEEYKTKHPVEGKTADVEDVESRGDDPSESDIMWVDWDGPSDPANPKNWTYRKKWAATLVVSSFTFISPVSSSMVAPATEQIAQEFGITNSVLMAIITSVFVLGFSIGPLFIGPLSEIYGRSRVLQISNLFYLAWNLGCGFAQNSKQLIAFRFLAGLGGSAPLSVGGGVLGDVWRPEERGRAIAIYSLAPLLGPVIGPVCGGWIAERSTWRWVFWATSIVDVIVQLSGLFFLKETFAPILLEGKAKRIRREVDAEKGQHKRILTIYESSEDRSWQHIFRKALIRPFQLFTQEYIIQLLGIYMAFLYGIFYLFLTTMPTIFREIYHEGVGIGGLHYIALGLGLGLASQTNARVMDKIYIYFKKKNGGVGEPEFRLPSMFPGTILLPFGLFLAGWSAQQKLHWILTDIGIASVGAGLILVFQATQTYVVDAFTLHAASALAAVSFLRSLAGFGFPLFAPAMYAKLGYGKGDTILACLAIGLGCPAPILLWKYGRRIRASSKYAHKGQMHHQPVSSAPSQPAGEKNAVGA